MLTSANIIADVDQGDHKVIVLFGALKLCRAALKLLTARVQVDPRAVGEFAVGAGDHFLQQRLGFVVFMLLHGTQAGFVILQ